MERFSKNFRNRLSDKLMDLANFIFVGFVISQFVEKGHISAIFLLMGSILGALFYYISYYIIK